MVDPMRRRMLALSPIVGSQNFATKPSTFAVGAGSAPLQGAVAKPVSPVPASEPLGDGREAFSISTILAPSVRKMTAASPTVSQASSGQDGVVKSQIDQTIPGVGLAAIRPPVAPWQAKVGAPHQNEVPAMPTPKRRDIFDGTEEWGASRSTRTSDDDDNYNNKLALVRKGRLIGYNHAADFLAHFLGNSGADMDPNPRVMLKEIPMFKSRNDDDFRDNILGVVQRAIKRNYRGQAIKIIIPGRWNAAEAERGDWYYTLHQFNFVNTAVAYVFPAANGRVDISIDSKLYVYDKYNWDPNKTARYGLYFGVDDEEMARLHQVGMAREYEVKGAMRYPRYVWRSVDPADFALRLP